MEKETMKKLLFIYNPYAGKARMASRLHEIVSIFQAAGYLVTVHATTAPRDATQTVMELAEDYDRIVCAGGDGTLSEIITGLMRTGYQGGLGYLPAGSTNDFSRTLGLPAGELEAARLAVSGQEMPCDIGGFNEHTFVYVAAFGIFTAVSYETPQEVKNILGHMAYVLEGIRSLAEITPYHLRIQWDGGEEEGDFLYGAISNSVSVGGFRVDGFLPDKVVLDDGLFEVILVRKPTSLAELNNIIGALLTNTPDVSVMAFQTRKMEIQSADEVPWTLDGENGGRHCVVQIRNNHNAIKMICKNGGQQLEH